VKRRTNSAAGLSSNAQAWLAGRPSGFFQFKHDDVLEALFEGHGDPENFFWRRDMRRPITLEDLEANEDAWLGSGDDDEYGRNSYFIDRHYSDSEKAALFKERGDKAHFRWRAGMRRPEAVTAIICTD
jgi:hypothetical protein